jgi:hypothetical protein
MFDFFPDGRLDDWKAKGLEKSSILGILKRNALQLEDTSTSPGRWTIQRRPEGKRLGYFKEVVEIFQVRILRDRCEHSLATSKCFHPEFLSSWPLTSCLLRISTAICENKGMQLEMVQSQWSNGRSPPHFQHRVTPSLGLDYAST